MQLFDEDVFMKKSAYQKTSLTQKVIWSFDIYYKIYTCYTKQMEKQQSANELQHRHSEC